MLTPPLCPWFTWVRTLTRIFTAVSSSTRHLLVCPQLEQTYFLPNSKSAETGAPQKGQLILSMVFSSFWKTIFGANFLPDKRRVCPIPDLNVILPQNPPKIQIIG